ncbi:CDP-alcohol phosphatidyltransferase family protein [Methylomarinum vadi]|uniref:CDP-alcohol phosphatidyltransferase family protein n=1 Tax=Methylomarinum vadi TaxID=438855 RepID=UPI0004DF63E1|nr:CDP-alcohol phosphatidyltransferase family protein [Methylomarinum vadi]
MKTYAFKQLLTLPNLLTSFRFVSAPILLGLAWHGYEQGFLLLLMITFLTDVLDGMAARMLDQESELGALLDTWGDLLIYTTIALSSWQLWPELMQRELLFASMVIISYLLPSIVGIAKFHAFPSYHTWLVKVAVACMGCSFFLLVLFDISWAFRLAAVLCVLAAGEEIAISCILPDLRSNVKSFWHVKRQLAYTSKN